MDRTILVPLDGAPHAERALSFAEAIARVSSARLVLATATEARTLSGAGAAEAQAAAVRDAETYLAGTADRLRSRGLKTPIETAVFYGGAAAGITEEVRLRAADLVVMATHGRTGPGRALLGSTADQVLRRVSVPVLLVSPACAYRWPGDRPLRILVPLDGSDLAAAALPALRTVAPAFGAVHGAEVHLLQVIEPAHGGLPGEAAPAFMADPEADLAAAVDSLEAIALALRSTGAPVTVDASVGPPAETIAAAARDHAVDVIVMATHGRGGLARLVLGSVAAGVLQRATVPLLLVRPAALREAAAGPAATTTTRASSPAAGPPA